MALDLLVINPPSLEFFYVPMGSIALCNWLVDQGFSSRILHLGNRHPTEVRQMVSAAIREYSPRNIGLVCHWKETLDGVLLVADEVHRRASDVPIWIGGLTASAFPSDLLSGIPFAKGVICGDSELPMEAICREVPLGEVPNLHYRDRETVKSPNTWWCADTRFLDSLRYGDLSVLDNAESYLRLIDTRLGFPLAIGRGCAFDCGYCGGSRSAFRQINHRSHLSLRSTDAIVADLEAAFRCGARTFLLSHTSVECKRVVKRLQQGMQSRLPITLHLETWTPPDDELLDLYAPLQPESGLIERHVLLSVHGALSSPECREERDAIVRAVEKIESSAPDCRVTVFSGFYTPWEVSGSRLEDELHELKRLRHRFSGKKVDVALMALSTDPGSRWATGGDGMESRLSIETLAKGVKRTDCVLNNLTLHSPRELTAEHRAHFEMIWHLDELLFTKWRMLWMVLTTGLRWAEYVRLLHRASRHLYVVEDDHVFPAFSEIATLAVNEIATVMCTCEQFDSTHAEVVQAYVRLLLAIVRVRRKQCTTENGQEVLAMPSFLTIDRSHVHESAFDFNALWRDLECDGCLSEDSFSQCHGTRGHYLYLLVPKCSPALHGEEIETLALWNGIVETEVVTQCISVRRQMPVEAVRERVRSLWNAGVLKGAYGE